MKELEKTRIDFPIFDQKVNGQSFIYFDSAATAQMPFASIDAISSFYETYKSNVDRGIYSFAEAATEHYERARTTVAEFIGAQPEEVIFNSGTTAGINMVSQIWAQDHIKAGDEIIVSEVEHHSNFLPWQHLAQSKGAHLIIIPVDDQGFFDLNKYYKVLSDRTKLVAINQTSNILGTTNDIASIVATAKGVGAKVLVDAAQSIAHKEINVKELDCDFLVFSGHKLFGPTGIGCLFIKKSVQAECKPQVFGGSMVYSAGYEDSFWKNAPYCFEAGTPPIAQAIGLHAAIEYLQSNVNFSLAQKHEAHLVEIARNGLEKLGFKLLSPAGSDHLVTFYDEDVHAHDIAMFLNTYGIAVRAGNHCVQPYHEKRGVESTIRASFAFYNTVEEVENFLKIMETL